MISKTAWVVRQFMRKIWVRTAVIALLGVVTALAGVGLAPWIPESLAEELGAESVDQILDILASSMLAVVTFSLSVAVHAYAAAASTATPRATQLLQRDPTTQNVLATFVGAFLFSLVGIIALHTGVYGAQGRVVLFVATIGVVLLVVVALLRWINHLMHFGRMDDTLARVEKASADALGTRTAEPTLGGTPWLGSESVRMVPDGAVAVYPETIGYVQHVDIEALSQFADEFDLEIWLADLPGSFIHLADPMMHVCGGTVTDEIAGKLRRPFTVAESRTFDQDPRFGLIALAEIASRALSPAVNDPGTAIDVLGRLVRVLSKWEEGPPPEVQFPRIHVPPIGAHEMVDDAFQTIARDGAGMIEVQIRLQKALAALGACRAATFGEATRAMAAESAERANAALTLAADKQRLNGVVQARMGATGAAE